MSKMINKLQKSALIFGANGAIGRELSKELAKTFPQLILSSFNNQKLDDLKQDIAKINASILIQTLPLDLRRYTSSSLTSLGTLNTVLFCSGVHSGLKYIDQLTDTEIEETFQINLTGMIKAARDVLSKTEEDGQIIFLNSMTNRQMARRNSALYETQKMALHRFIQAYRNEAVLKKIKVIEVNIGLLESQLTYDAYGGQEEFKKKFKNMNLLKPQAVVRTIQWLLNSQENEFITELNLTTVDQCSQQAMMN